MQGLERTRYLYVETRTIRLKSAMLIDRHPKWSAPWRLLLLGFHLSLLRAVASENYMRCLNVFPRARETVDTISDDDEAPHSDWTISAHYPQGRREETPRVRPGSITYPQEYYFPLGLTQDSFASLEDLCAHNEEHGNAGCKCLEDPAVGTNRIGCFPDRRSRAIYLQLFLAFRVWCQAHCRCRNNKDYEDQEPVEVATIVDWYSQRDMTERGPDLTRQRSIQPPRARRGWSAVMGRILPRTRAAKDTCDVNEEKSSSGDGTILNCSGCNKRCLGPEDCRSRQNGCNCNAQITETLNGQAWLGICGISTGKRELEPCLCNASYISLSCCGKPDGIVWERPEMFLGAVSESL